MAPKFNVGDLVRRIPSRQHDTYYADDRNPFPVMEVKPMYALGTSPGVRSPSGLWHSENSLEQIQGLTGPVYVGDWLIRINQPNYGTTYTVGSEPFQVVDKFDSPSINPKVKDVNGQWHDVANLAFSHNHIEENLRNSRNNAGRGVNSERSRIGLQAAPDMLTEPIRPSSEREFTFFTEPGPWDLSVEVPVDDGVNHPTHYNRGGIEVVDIIDAYGLDFYTGSGIKYVLRSQYKENEIKDLKKAVDVLNKKIALLEGN